HGAPRSRLVVARGNDVLVERETPSAVGVPAVRGGMVFVPWGTQNVGVVDAAGGRALGGLRVDDVVGTAFVDRGQVYVGHHGVFRFTPRIEAGLKQRAAYFTPRSR